MLPMDRVELTAYRFLGGIGSCFTLFQSLIWLGMSITGVACKYLECGSSNNKRSFGYCFYLMYVYSESDDTSGRLNFINPYYFNIIMWINLALSAINLVISTIMLIVFLQWTNAVLVKRIAKIWAVSIILFSIMECVMCAAFIYDIFIIVRNDESKCFMKADIKLFRSVYEPKPAPYLHELKSKLHKLKWKIRKFKKSLIFLDVVVDENENPKHLENPFIAKTTLNKHVKDVWRKMFKNNITDNVPQKRFLPHDEEMKKFIIKKQIDLDEVDANLLRSFDSLSNIKWVKPVERSNVAIGTKFYLNANVSLGNDTSDINQMAIILHEYLKSINKPGELANADNLLDNVTKMYLDKLFVQMQDFQNENLKIKFKNITKEIRQNGTLATNNYEEEEILMYLKQFFNGLLSLEQIDDNMNEKLFLSLVNNITDLFKNNGSFDIDNDQRIKNIKEYIRKQYDLGFKNNKEPDMSARRANISSKTTSSSSKLVKELCDNCAFFALWPSLVCMLLSLKTGLVWFLNVIVVSLVLYYGDKIEVRRRSRLSSIIKYD